MKKIIGMLLITLMIVGVVAGCRVTSPPPTDPPQQETPKTGEDTVVEEKEWPQEKEDTIIIEGMKEPITLNLVDGRNNNFVTYAPEDFVVETASSGEGDSYWFYSNFVGNKRDDVYLQLFFYPEFVKEPSNLIGEKGMLTARGFDLERVSSEDQYHPWSLEEYRSKSGETSAFLGKHQERYFLMVIDYPAEFGDGVSPRIGKILENLYWTDTNTYLIKEE